MRYEVSEGSDTFRVEVHEAGPHSYDVTIDDGETVRVDAFRNARTVYSLLIGARQFEGSVDERENGTLDVHVGSSAFDFVAIDERKKLLGATLGSVASGPQTIRAQMPGKVVRVLVREGEVVESGQGLCVIEAMKMENVIKSPIAGVVSELGMHEGDPVEAQQLLAVVNPPAAES